MPKGGPADQLQNPWHYFSTTNSTWEATVSASGRYWQTTVAYPQAVWYAVTGYRHWLSGILTMCGIEISNWTTTRDTKNYYLFSNSGLVNPSGYQGGYSVSAIGFPVRCVRE